MRLMLPVLRRAADALIAEGHRKSGSAITCREGCAACCRQLVPLAATEARELRSTIERLPDEKRLAVQRRFVEALTKLRAAGLLDLMTHTAAVPHDALEVLGRQYLSAWIDCPFLKDERCTIYKSRPMACRQDLVSSDPAQCWRPDSNVKRIVPPSRAMNAALDAAEGANWVPLPLLLSAHDPPRSFGMRAARKWLEEVWRLATRDAGRVRIAPA